jgi:hypothetical protein
VWTIFWCLLSTGALIGFSALGYDRFAVRVMFSLEGKMFADWSIHSSTPNRCTTRLVSVAFRYTITVTDRSLPPRVQAHSYQLSINVFNNSLRAADVSITISTLCLFQGLICEKYPRQDPSGIGFIFDRYVGIYERTSITPAVAVDLLQGWSSFRLSVGWTSRLSTILSISQLY